MHCSARIRPDPVQKHGANAEPGPVDARALEHLCPTFRQSRGSASDAYGHRTSGGGRLVPGSVLAMALVASSHRLCGRDPVTSRATRAAIPIRVGWKRLGGFVVQRTSGVGAVIDIAGPVRENRPSPGGDQPLVRFVGPHDVIAHPDEVASVRRTREQLVVADPVEEAHLRSQSVLQAFPNGTDREGREPPGFDPAGPAAVRYQSGRTFCASSPFLPRPTSNSTRWPSCRVLYPSP